MRSSDGRGTGHKNSAERSKKPGIRINSDKVQPLKPESLVEVEEQSEFSQWRQGHREIREQDLIQPQVEKTEEQVPWWRRRVKSAALVLGVLAAVALLFVAVVFYSPLLAIKTIDIEGANLVPQSTVEEKLQQLEGTPLTRVTDQRVADLVGYQNVLRDVTVEAKPPHGLVVKLQERVPVAVVKDKDQYVLVDNEGVQLSRVATREDAKLPLIDGGLAVLGTGEFQTVTSVLAALPSSLLSQVVSAKADSPSSTNLVLADDVQVVWGTAEDSELKAKVLTELMGALEKENTVSTYDVSSPLRPTTK